MATHERLRQHTRFPAPFVGHSISRLVTGLLIACSLLAAATTAVAQHTPRRTVPKPIDFATSLFSLVRPQDDIHSLEQALEELSNGKPEAAVRRLHELLRVDPHGVVPVAPGRFLGIRTAVVTVLANMSPAAKEAYEQLALREAGSLLRRDLKLLSPGTNRWPAIGGGRSGATPMAEPVGNPAPFWRHQVIAPGFERREKGQLSMFTVGDLDGMFVNTGRDLIAFDPLRKEIKWISASPVRDFGGEPQPTPSSPTWCCRRPSVPTSSSPHWRSRTTARP